MDSIAPAAFILAVFGTGGWVFTTWLRIKHGYPLEGFWGQKIEPSGGGQTAERVRLIGQENAQLRAELAAVKDRIAVLERIATDEGRNLALQIEDLRKPVN
jgi:hypothetical protein